MVYTVERIVRSFTRNGERFYMVKWRGWSSRDNTVEPEDQLVALAQSGKIIWRGLPGRDPNCEGAVSVSTSQAPTAMCSWLSWARRLGDGRRQRCAAATHRAYIVHTVCAVRACM